MGTNQTEQIGKCEYKSVSTMIELRRQFNLYAAMGYAVALSYTRSSVIAQNRAGDTIQIYLSEPS